MNKLFEILRCPVCKDSLEHKEDKLECHKCRINYNINDNIPNLIPSSIDESIKRSVSGWSNLPYDYNASIRITGPERFKAIDLPLLEQCTEGKNVLEIGCGSARLYSPIKNAKCNYIGIDPSEKLLKLGKGFAEGSLVQGIGEALPFPDNYFDIIIGPYCSYRYIKLDDLYRECARVIKPGGTMAFTLWNNWSLFFNNVLGNLKQVKIRLPKFKDENCNDVVSPLKEKKLLKKFGFKTKKILSTRNTPILNKLPILKKFFGWQYHWRGSLGALMGYDIIFICIYEK